MKILSLLLIFSCSNLGLKKVDKSGLTYHGDKRLDSSSSSQKKPTIARRAIIVEEKKEKKVITRKMTLYFTVNSFELTDHNTKKLKSFIKKSKNYGEINQAQIIGHTDITGSVEHNLQLSKKRAQSVYDILAKNLNLEKIQVKGEGASNASQNDYERDRKVELKIYLN